MSINKSSRITSLVMGGLVMFMSCTVTTAFADDVQALPEEVAAPVNATDEAPVDVPATPLEAMAPVTDMPADVAADTPASQYEPVNSMQPRQPEKDGSVSTNMRKVVNPNRVLMKASVANLKVGNAVLEDNRYKPGVVTLKSGLQYKVIKAGAGARPRDEDIVKCNYRGSLVDGTIFEQSEAGKPASVKVAPLTPGLKEAIKLMPVGSKWLVYMPPALGFGSAGKLPAVGPDAVLVYELELLGIVAAVPNKR